MAGREMARVMDRLAYVIHRFLTYIFVASPTAMQGLSIGREFEGLRQLVMAALYDSFSAPADAIHHFRAAIGGQRSVG